MKKVLIAGLTVALMASAAVAAKGGGRISTSTTTLTDAQKDTLVYVYQEEKLARDVYTTLGEVYPNQSTFANIKSSEQTHIDKAEGLCDKYNADTSAINEGEVGEFVLPVMQELYDTLVAKGMKSERDALEVGVAIEELDIDDLTHAKEGMPSDVVNTYDNLISGSYNHLSAFTSALNKL